jgi:Macrocin-O-methyltransferase (TylF)
MSKNISVEGGLRNPAELEEAGRNKECFEHNPESWESKMESFPKYVKRQNLTRLLALYEIFKKIINVKGSIVECGVFRGFGIMSWSKFSAIMEPVNLTRKIYGFDSFSGFPSVSQKDIAEVSKHVAAGDLYANSFDELNELINIHDSTRFINHIKKTQLIKGDATKTIPKFIKENPHVLVSLLFLDFDLYEPTKIALEYFLPRMPKGAIIAFDELDNPLWPGETLAMLEHFKGRIPRIERIEFDPYIGFAVLD